MVRNVGNNSWYCINNVFKGLYMSSCLVNDRITDGGRWEMKFPPFKTKNNEIKDLIKCLYGREIKEISSK